MTTAFFCYLVYSHFIEERLYGEQSQFMGQTSNLTQHVYMITLTYTQFSAVSSSTFIILSS